MAQGMAPSGFPCARARGWHEEGAAEEEIKSKETHDENLTSFMVCFCAGNCMKRLVRWGVTAGAPGPGRLLRTCG